MQVRFGTNFRILGKTRQAVENRVNQIKRGNPLALASVDRLIIDYDKPVLTKVPGKTTSMSTRVVFSQEEFDERIAELNHFMGVVLTNEDANAFLQSESVDVDTQLENDPLEEAVINQFTNEKTYQDKLFNYSTQQMTFYNNVNEEEVLS